MGMSIEEMKGPDKKQEAGLPDSMPMIPMGGRESVPSLNDTEYDRLVQLVKEYPDFADNEEDPRYTEWEGLQRRADADLDRGSAVA